MTMTVSADAVLFSCSSVMRAMLMALAWGSWKHYARVDSTAARSWRRLGHSWINCRRHKPRAAALLELSLRHNPVASWWRRR